MQQVSESSFEVLQWWQDHCANPSCIQQAKREGHCKSGAPRRSTIIIPMLVYATMTCNVIIEPFLERYQENRENPQQSKS